MEDRKVLNVVNVSFIAQQMYNKMIKCTVEWFLDGFGVVCDDLRYFNGPHIRPGKTGIIKTQ